MRLQIILLLLVIPMVSADLGTFQQDSCVDIKTILNATTVNISSISYPNSTVSVTNQAMTKTGQTFNYTYCDTSVIGVYLYDYFDDANNVYVNSFEITYTGEDFNEQDARLYGILLLVLVGFGVSTALVIRKLPGDDKRDEEGRILQVSWLKYLRWPLWAVVYLVAMSAIFYTSNISYAYNNGVIGSLLFSIFLVMGIIGTIGLIIFGLRLFDNILSDVNKSKMLERGIDV